ANNAMFGAQAVYDDLVPAFEALFEREGRDWHRFHAAAAKLADLPKKQREEALKNMTHENGKPGV
ncbi:MAG: aminopeptidase, partial [Variovorax sp.]